MTPTVFISYSHDNELHKDWVLQLATRLRSNGVEVLLGPLESKAGARFGCLHGAWFIVIQSGSMYLFGSIRRKSEWRQGGRGL
ncbi:toll/interleukin-1 receptor domain-containing protein [Rahnella aceris]|nr:toll/interleukin-1 receptor domain-containing protein [Rahnella aceris]